MSWENRSVLLEELLFSGFLPSVLSPKLPSSEAVCMQPDSCRKIKLDLIFNCMGSFEFGVVGGEGIKALWCKLLYFSVKQKWAFQNTVCFGKLALGWKTQHLQGHPFMKSSTKNHNAWGRGKNTRARGSVWGAVPVIFQRNTAPPVFVEEFDWFGLDGWYWALNCGVLVSLSKTLSCVWTDQHWQSWNTFSQICMLLFRI